MSDLSRGDPVGEPAVSGRTREASALDLAIDTLETIAALGEEFVRSPAATIGHADSRVALFKKAVSLAEGALVVLRNSPGSGSD